jgi:hypothetical protein
MIGGDAKYAKRRRRQMVREVIRAFWFQEAELNSGSNLTSSFGGWRRCSLVIPCRDGYARGSRLAIRPNPGVILLP